MGSQVFNTMVSNVMDGVAPPASQKTRDGFQNLLMRLGVGAPGTPGADGNQISGGRFWFNLITRNRIQLEAAFRGSWIVGRIVNCVAEDMTKAGIILNTSKGASKIQKFKAEWSRLKISQTTCDTIAWGRLYGGAIGVFQIEGQDMESELDPETITKGQFLGIAVYDRWQLNPVLSQVIESGPDIGLPAYYDIVLGSNLNDPGQVPGGTSQTQQSNPETQKRLRPTQQNVGGTVATSSRVRVHHSRCFRMGGIKLPFFQAITEMMWDESVIERLWDRLIEFETASASAGGLIGRALLRTVGIENFRQVLAAGGEAKEGMLEMFEMMRQFQNSEGLTLLDKEDTFQTTAYSFAGLAEMIGVFGEQMSGAAECPLVRLFGQSPAGLGGNGDTDLRNYYDGINARQESKLRDPYELLISILWRSTFGRAAPDDLTFTFTPLWQMTAKDKADINAQNTTAIIGATEAGIISTPTALKELKQSSVETGVFTHITDEEIEQAENEPPPVPEGEVEPETVGEETGEPGNGPGEPKEMIKKIGINKDSAWARMMKMFAPKPKEMPKLDGPTLKPKRKMTADQKAILEFNKK